VSLRATCSNTGNQGDGPMRVTDAISWSACYTSG